MQLLFPGDSLEVRQPDEAFAAEVAAADELKMPWSVLDLESLVRGRDGARAVRCVRTDGADPAVYRGWMLRPDEYARLHDALAAHGVRLLTDPPAYRHAHYLPENYPVLAGRTPRSAWLEIRGEPPWDSILELARSFGQAPVVLKDYVKSQKHLWLEACFIPDASSRGEVERVVRRFLAEQGPDLNEGLVFREFVELERIGRDSRSGFPLSREHRIFVVDGEPVFTCRSWDEGEYTDVAIPVERFQDTMKRVRSRFFSLDLARRRDGEWTILELGDGQVAGLPEGADPRAFLAALQARLDGQG
ncbi:MAG: ATP-grasp domain-containing protein [Planctomycetes bacterium]|nr:ATP-grasp domain-containing protein [Planctomycetota bacterium]